MTRSRYRVRYRGGTPLQRMLGIGSVSAALSFVVSGASIPTLPRFPRPIAEATPCMIDRFLADHEGPYLCPERNVLKSAEADAIIAIDVSWDRVNYQRYEISEVMPFAPLGPHFERSVYANGTQSAWVDR